MAVSPAMRELLGTDAPSNWGKWGPDDELGCLNYLDAKEVLRGIRHVRTGDVFTLQVQMGQANPGPGAAGLQPPERLEHAGLELVGDPGAVIDDLQEGRCVGRAGPQRRGRPAASSPSALANRLARTRSSRPGSVRTRGRSSGTQPHPVAGVQAAQRDRGHLVDRGRAQERLQRPGVSRLMSSRLPISASSRSAHCSMVASSSASSSSRPAARRSGAGVLTLALIEASGVRRSWLTAASSAVRIRLPSASASAWAAWVRSRSRSSAAAAWAAKPCQQPGR